MVSIIFPYIPHRNKLKPLAKIKFNYPEKDGISFAALIDSGADNSCSFVEVGEMLGIDFSQFDKEENVAYGIEGKGLPGYKAPITYWIGDKDITEDVRWLDIKFDPETNYFFVLGRNKVFKEFDIEFQERKERVIFRRK